MKHLPVYMAVTVMVLFSSCNVTRKLPAGQHLLTKNDISITYPDSLPRKERPVYPDDLRKFIPTRQTPNKRLLGINFFLWIYNLSDTTKHGIFQRFFRKVGEEPVLFDSLSVRQSNKDMRLFMQSAGFYEARVSDTVRYRKKRAFVDYKVSTGIPFKIDSIGYRFDDKSLENIILADTSRSLLKPGSLLSRTVMEQERSRIARMLGNAGYFQFSVNNISYTVDTLSGNYRAKVQINIGRNRNGAEAEDNRIYRIKTIYVIPDYDPARTAAGAAFDTVEYKGYHFIWERGKKQNLRPETIVRALTIYPNLIYSQRTIDYTSSNLTNLKFFKNVNILFRELPADETETVSFIGQEGEESRPTREGALECTIQCQPILRQGYKVESEISTNANYTGVSLALGYVNKNIFRGAETFDFSVKGAYDFMRATGKKDSYELGFSTSLSFPHLLLPLRVNRRQKLHGVNTRIDVSYSTQRRPDYDRTLSSVSFGYTWTRGRFSNYVFKPISISVINVPWINQAYLNSIQNHYLRNSYQSQLIFGMYGSYSYSTQNTPRINSHALKINAESSGNFLNLLSVMTKAKRVYGAGNDNHYDFLGIRYAQYFRGDLSYVFRHKFNDKGSALVFRLYGGGGRAYGNTRSIPFERMLFAGGSSSMRGWQVRTLGPGGTPEQPDTQYPNQVGDLKLEANMEARFGIFGPLKGALFFDLGNIWSNGKGETNPEARFKLNTFYKQLALNTGIGARFDFNYFILRVDWGIQLRNPGWGAGREWIRSFKFRNTAVHFGIGYPF